MMQNKMTQYKFTKNVLLVAILSSVSMTGFAATSQLLGDSASTFKLIPFVIAEKISVYKIATLSNLTIEQLNSLNKNAIKGRTSLSKGETIFLPANSELVKGNNATLPSPEIVQSMGHNTLNAGTPPATVSNANSDNSTLLGLDVDELLKPSDSMDTQEINKEIKPAPSAIETETQLNTHIVKSEKVVEEIKDDSAPVIIQDNNNVASSLTTNELKPSADEAVTSITQTHLESSLSLTPKEPAIMASAPIVQHENDAINTVTKEEKAHYDAAAAKFTTLPTLNSLIEEKEESTTLAQNMPTAPLSNSLTNIAQTFGSQFGTAEIAVNVDENFNYQETNFKLLTELFSSNDGMLFSQFGATHQDKSPLNKTNANLGIGYRHDLENLRLGVNTFIDTDFDDSARMSLGTELSTDYLSLSANYYTPLTGWKISSIEDISNQVTYSARAAEGIDLILQGYLPQYPQLGAGITLEQYFGNQVKLFENNRAQKDPYAMTASVDYSPIPLVSLKASHRMGSNSMDDSKFSMDVNYRFGIPFDAQIDPNNLQHFRSLKGSRHDLVKRNYQITYEYRSQAGAVQIFAPKQAYINDIVSVQTEIADDIQVEEYIWSVQSPQSTLKYHQKNLNLDILHEGHYTVQLQVKTRSNEIKTSNTLHINSSFSKNNELIFTTLKPQGLAITDLNELNTLQNSAVILHLEPENKNQAITLPVLEWQDSNKTLCPNWCKVTPNNHYLKAETVASEAGGWLVYLYGHESLIDNSINIRASTLTNAKRQQVNADGTINFY